MGYGNLYTCKECGQTFQCFLGFGLEYMEEYKKYARAMSKGKAGEEIQEIFNSGKKIVLNINSELYQCKHCDNWTFAPRLDIYEVVKPENHNNKHVHGLKNVLIVNPEEIKGRDFKLIKKSQFSH